MERYRRVLPILVGRTPGPGLLTPLQGDVRWAGVWLVLRVGLGSLWLDTGWRSLHSTTSGGDLAVAQILAGIALILGLLTGLAATVGAVISADTVLTGTAPLMTASVLLAVWLVMTWRTAGLIGFDRWLVPALTYSPGEGKRKRRDRAMDA